MKNCNNLPAKNSFALPASSAGRRVGKTIYNNNGTALLMALMILSGILVVSLGMANLIIPGIKMSRIQGYSTKAYFAAEAGVERALWVRRKSDYDFSACASSGECLDFDDFPVNCGDCPNTIETLGDSEYNINYASSTIDMYITFTSIGSYQNIQRSLEIKYTE